MKLSFSLLVVDDNPDSISEAILSLEDHLDAKGFALDRTDESNLSEQKLKELVQSEGRNYDLVIIDYNLGQGAINGAEAARRLRLGLPYTDIVFYSSDRGLDLHDTLAGQRVSGVFIAGRDDLDSTLTSLADKLIGKAVDLNHMRGIAMAEVAEMDVLMEETLVRFFCSSNPQVDIARDRTISRLRKDARNNMNLIDKTYDKSGLPGVVSKGRIFSSTQKFLAVKSLAKSLGELSPDTLEVFESYDREIIRNRNRLAHVKEESSEDGQVILRSLGSDKGDVIDDNWMTNFRQRLRTHRYALTSVCRAIDTQLSFTDALHDSQKGQP